MAPGHSFLFGHLLYLKSCLDKIPKNAHYQSAFGDIARQHFLKQGLFYLDLWPVSGLFLVNVSPKVAVQIHASPDISMQRPKLLPRFFKPICGGPNMFDLPEDKWKIWRTIFSKGFSSDHNLSLVPSMVDETLIFCETLRTLSQQSNVVCLDSVALRFTIDVIGRTVL